MQAQLIIVILQHNTATLQLFSEPVYSEVSAYSHHLIAIYFRTTIVKKMHSPVQCTNIVYPMEVGLKNVVNYTESSGKGKSEET